MRVADVLAEGLACAGVRHAFGIPGGEVLTLIDALERAGIRMVTARHETAAGLMAEGAWHGNDAPGLLVVTVGPGVSNAVNAVANAALDRVPLIVISGAIDPELRAAYTHQVFDQAALLRPVVKGTFVAGADNARVIIAQALALAVQHPRGPVHIELPVAHADAHLVEPPGVAAHDVPGASSATPHAAAELARIAGALTRARRPLLLVGLEAADARTTSALRALLDARAMPVLTTYKAKGVLDERDPHCIGAVALSPKADACVRPLLDSADVVCLVGYDPVEMRASYVRPFGSKTLVLELAAAPRSHGMHTAHTTLVGDIAEHLMGLREQLCRSRQADAWSRDTLPQRTRAALRAAFACHARARVSSAPATTQGRAVFAATSGADTACVPVSAQSGGDASGLSPLAAAQVLASVLTPDVRVTVDTGAHRIILSQVLQASAARQVLQSNGLCTMGYALPCAIGLSLCSGRRVVAAMGDGGFEMVMGELATLRDLDLPVTLLVFDDSSLALIDVKQQSRGLARHAVWLGTTDHVGIARSLGGRGVRVHDGAGLRAALTDALSRPRGFTVIACAIERGAYAELL